MPQQDIAPSKTPEATTTTTTKTTATKTFASQFSFHTSFRSKSCQTLPVVEEPRIQKPKMCNKGKCFSCLKKYPIYQICTDNTIYMLGIYTLNNIHIYVHDFEVTENTCTEFSI